ncbi:MAG: putative Ig domain-containing protein [Acidobacteriota bacterium]|nr:putative Ig domain-containing protein [Acidobacteriota bacterium]
MSQNQSTLTFITESLPGFFVGESAQVDIEASGGTTPYSFEITEGTLPNGLHLTEGGRISGTPTESGDTTVFVKVTDNEGSHLTQAYDVQVSASDEQSTGGTGRSTSAS